MLFFSNEKDIAKIPTDLNSRGPEEHFSIIRENLVQKIVSGVGRVDPDAEWSRVCAIPLVLAT